MSTLGLPHVLCRSRKILEEKANPGMRCPCASGEDGRSPSLPSHLVFLVKSTCFYYLAFLLTHTIIQIVCSCYVSTVSLSLIFTFSTMNILKKNEFTRHRPESMKGKWPGGCLGTEEARRKSHSVPAGFLPALPGIMPASPCQSAQC